MLFASYFYRPDRILWSDIHSLGYLLEEEYQESPTVWASEMCIVWQDEDDMKGEFDAVNVQPSTKAYLISSSRGVGPGCDMISELHIINFHFK